MLHYTVKNIRISIDISCRVFHSLTESVPYTFVWANLRNFCGPGLHYSVDLRVQTYTEPVPLKYGKLATKYPWICWHFYSVDGPYCQSTVEDYEMSSDRLIYLSRLYATMQQMPEWRSVYAEAVQKAEPKVTLSLTVNGDPLLPRSSVLAATGVEECVEGGWRASLQPRSCNKWYVWVHDCPTSWLLKTQVRFFSQQINLPLI